MTVTEPGRAPASVYLTLNGPECSPTENSSKSFMFTGLSILKNLLTACPSTPCICSRAVGIRLMTRASRHTSEGHGRRHLRHLRHRHRRCQGAGSFHGPSLRGVRLCSPRI